MKVKLTVVQGKPEGKEFVLPVNPFVIGRDKKCHLRPNNEAIAEKHCAIIAKSDRVLIRDLGSATGTQVNGQKIESDTVVSSGDLLQVGPLVFAITVAGAKKQAATAKASAASSAAAPQQNAEDDIDVADWLGGGDDDDAAAEQPAPKAATGVAAPNFDDLDMPTDPMDPLAPPPEAQQQQERNDEAETKNKASQSNEAATSRAASDLLRKYFTRPRE